MYMKPYDNICSSECFHINTWNERSEQKDNPNSVIVDHNAYWIGEEKSKSFFRGFGGHQFKINFYDGRYIESTNLWDNGEIPEEYWDKLPNNAEFLKEESITYKLLFE